MSTLPPPEIGSGMDEVSNEHASGHAARGSRGRRVEARISAARDSVSGRLGSSIAFRAARAIYPAGYAHRYHHPGTSVRYARAKEVQVYQVRSLDRPLFIVFAQNSEGIIVTSQTREQGMMECAVSSSLFSVYVIKKRVH